MLWVRRWTAGPTSRLGNKGLFDDQGTNSRGRCDDLFCRGGDVSFDDCASVLVYEADPLKISVKRLRTISLAIACPVVL